MVHGSRRRFDGWANGFQGCHPHYPALDSGLRRDLRALAMFYQVMSMRGQVQVPERDWSTFVMRLLEGLTMGRVQRGEAHLAELGTWLRTRYPVRTASHFSPDLGVNRKH